MLANLNGWHAVIIIAVFLLLFGAPRIPQLARSIGQSMRILKTESRDEQKPATPESATIEEPLAR